MCYLHAINTKKECILHGKRREIMVRIYRFVLVAVLIALISWGVWYVVSNYNKQSIYEDGVLVRKEVEGVYGTGYYLY